LASTSPYTPQAATACAYNKGRRSARRPPKISCRALSLLPLHGVTRTACRAMSLLHLHGVERSACRACVLLIAGLLVDVALLGDFGGPAGVPLDHGRAAVFLPRAGEGLAAAIGARLAVRGKRDLEVAA